MKTLRTASINLFFIIGTTHPAEQPPHGLTPETGMLQRQHSGDSFTKKQDEEAFLELGSIAPRKEQRADSIMWFKKPPSSPIPDTDFSFEPPTLLIEHEHTEEDSFFGPEGATIEPKEEKNQNTIMFFEQPPLPIFYPTDLQFSPPIILALSTAKKSATRKRIPEKTTRTKYGKCSCGEYLGNGFNLYKHTQETGCRLLYCCDLCSYGTNNKTTFKNHNQQHGLNSMASAHETN